MRLERLQPPTLPPLSAADLDKLSQIEHELGYKFNNPRILYVATYCKEDELPTGPFKSHDTNSMYGNMGSFATLGDSLIAFIVYDICQLSNYRRSMYLYPGRNGSH